VDKWGGEILAHEHLNLTQGVRGIAFCGMKENFRNGLMAALVFALSSGRKLIMLALMLSAGPSWKTDFPSHFGCYSVKGK
jgi:hypothetical protein